MRSTHGTGASFSSNAYSIGATVDGMIALVTGANQGLGRALAEGLAGHADRVLLTGRNPERVFAAADELGVEGRVLDVRDRDAIFALAEELGEVDVVFSNATARMTPGD